MRVSKGFPAPVSSLLIGKLATDRREEGRGGAGVLLDFALRKALEIRKSVGCSHLVTHAKTSLRTIEWYRRKGFTSDLDDFKGLETALFYLELP